jgi:hypothetical protein
MSQDPLARRANALLVDLTSPDVHRVDVDAAVHLAASLEELALGYARENRLARAHAHQGFARHRGESPRLAVAFRDGLRIAPEARSYRELADRLIGAAGNAELTLIEQTRQRLDRQRAHAARDRRPARGHDTRR